MSLWSKEDVELFRQWFDCCDDVNPIYLEQRDYKLAERIYNHLGMRVPNRIKEKTSPDVPQSKEKPMNYIYESGVERPMHIQRTNNAGQPVMEAICGEEHDYNRTINAPFGLGRKVCSNCKKKLYVPQQPVKDLNDES